MPLSRSARRFHMHGLAIGLLLATPAFAHDALPNTWCLNPNTTPAIVKHFDFAPETLSNYRKRNPVLTNPPEGVTCSDERSCGIVDDWFWANQMSQEFCAVSSQQRTASPASTPMPFVRLPESYNARDHHERYNFGSGRLIGVCVVCVTSNTPVPAPELPQPSRDL
jgi:hypothetical protein